MTTCRQITEFLADYIGGELNASVRADFESHIEGCPDCVTFIAQYRRTIEVSHTAYDDVQTEPIPSDLVQAILQSLKKN